MTSGQSNNHKKEKAMSEKRRQSWKIGNGIFFVGLGLLFLTGWWWPGIALVFAASALGRALAAGKSWQEARGALLLAVIALLFSLPGLMGSLSGAFWRWLPLIFVGLGLYMLFSGRCRSLFGHGDDDEKRKNKRKNDNGGDIHQV